MPITVHIPTPLRRYSDGADRLTCAVTSLPELFNHLEQSYPRLKPHLRDADGKVRAFLSVYVNEEDIRFLGGDSYHFQDGDEVLLVPSIAGGAPESPVTVPATSANLGCAFDCAAVALNLYFRATVHPGDGPGFEVHYRGPHAERIPTDESNLILRALRRVSEFTERELRGGVVEVDNEIPIGIGLGSSAAAIVAGLLLGARLCDTSLEPHIALRLAHELEGHPDNVSAAYHGGLVVAAVADVPPQVLALKTRVPPELEFVAVIPELPVATGKARGVLPSSYARTDAVHNLQRAVLLAASCFSGQHRLLPELFRDRLHQPYRAGLVPGVAECLELQHSGLLGVCLSGSGSAVLAIVEHSADRIARLLVERFLNHGVQAQALFLRAENRGAREWEAAVSLAPELFPSADAAEPRRGHSTLRAAPTSA